MLDSRPMFPARSRSVAAIGLTLAGCLFLAACGPASSVGPTPPIRPGTAESPREITVLGMEYQFAPPVLDVVPGEVVLIHFLNAGLATHELVLGDAAIQSAWEGAEAAARPAAPGQTPAIDVPPGETGLRLVAQSGQRVDAIWHVPADFEPVIAGCHIPGHWARGMQAAVRFIAASSGASPAGSELSPAAP